MMRVAIDASPLLVRSAGVKNYLHYWIRALEPHLDIELFPKLRDPGPLRHTRFRPGHLALLQLSHLAGTDMFLRGADVFHASNLVRKPPARALLTATLHDMTAWRMPQLHTESTLLAEQRFAANIAGRAAGLIAVSESTKRDAVEILNLPADRITVIHSGVSDAFFAARPMPSERPYVLFVGTIEPRKNIDVLLNAWESLRPEGYDLVIAGPAGWRSERTIAHMKGIAKWLGYVPESELPCLTAGATAFVYPSLYEGFGFPVAQAMAAGVPVVTSNVSSLPEIAGDAALLVDPHSISEIKSALRCVLYSPSLRADLAQRGRERAQAKFRWELCARRSVEFFSNLAG